MQNLIDNPAAKDDVAVVKHDRLPGGYGLLRFLEDGLNPVIFDDNPAGRFPFPVTDLGMNFFGPVPNQDTQISRSKSARPKVLFAADNDPVPLRVDGGYVKWRFMADSQAATLSNRKKNDALVLAEFPALPIDNPPRVNLRQAAGDEGPIIPLRYEADVLAFPFFCNGKPGL